MNILLIVPGILVATIAMLFIIALFTKKEYVIERNVIINKGSNEVFQYIKYLRNQENFSKWVMMDPNMQKKFRGTDGTVGFVYAWEGNKQAGKGEQEIMKMEEGKRLDIEVRFEKPFVSVANTPFTIESLSSQQSKVTWAMDSKMNYPMNIMLLFMNMDKLLGKDMETSLHTLKGILEKR